MIEQLEGEEGLVLRPWALGDAGAVLEAFAPADMTGQSAQAITTLEAAQAWITAVGSAWESGRGFTWAITGGGQVLGSVSVSAIEPEHGTGWVSYFTLPAARGRGVASAGLRAASAWALGDLGLHRLELGHRVNNPASCAVATAAGFAVEGRQREKLRYGDQRFDVELHARLATDSPPPELAAVAERRQVRARSATPDRGRDPGLDVSRGDPSLWLTLELGVANDLRRHGIDVGAPLERYGRHPLVLEAAETLFPESAVDNLPPIAREEIAAGLGGPLREAIAAAEPRGSEIEALRDALVTRASALDPQRGAIVVADQVHLQRLVRGDVPTIVALGCLSWYAAYRQPEDPHAEALTALCELEQAWRHHPDQRAGLDEQIHSIAVAIVGEHPTALVDDPF